MSLSGIYGSTTVYYLDSPRTHELGPALKGSVSVKKSTKTRATRVSSPMRRYTVKSYVVAQNAVQALRIARSRAADEVSLDDETEERTCGF